MSDYSKGIKQQKEKIDMIEGKILRDVLVHIVEPEYNIAYLVFDHYVYEICGLMGSEILGICEISYIDYKGKSNGRNIKKFKPYEIFLDKEIVQVRIIGEEWNGHGFEFSFKEVYDKTMIIQSIYSGNKPDEFEDCIRLGIGQYYYSCN
ncbi:hypothetical protein [Vallitalea okinawensis]|uniref:hypothetical protein n=1 Tax=Vallitalea okinawensis TaxID=2078660 RepID=UPI000CFBD04D|nr:hypothetical protein [Vallitalea okinawensis]